ncbi:MAG: NAD(P)H-dependent oxidoreductase [Thermoactinospora sp.]|nr:NAD(P)H-dependent oxidoreductase [Thermoactinospora sp.]
MSIVTVIGNPRAGSRTAAAAQAVTDALVERLEYTGPRDTVDLSALGPALLAPGAHAALEIALELVRGAGVIVFASPTYKATYTGLLKAFVDRLPPNALAGRTAVPVLVMGDARHALAVEAHFRPLLVELGAHVPTPGLALLESELAELDVLDGWARRVAPQIRVAQEVTR